MQLRDFRLKASEWRHNATEARVQVATLDL
jgi:hypothetical protein